jgi:hypothetical protein
MELTWRITQPTYAENGRDARQWLTFAARYQHHL